MTVPPTVSKLLVKLAVLATAILVIVVLRLATNVVEHNKETAAGTESSVRTSDDLLQAAKAVLPTAASARRDEAGNPARLTDDSGRTVGFAIDTTGMPGLVDGYNGLVPVAIILDDSGRISGFQPLRNDETPSYMDRVISSGFLDSLKGKTAGDAMKAGLPDTVSGATFTSRAMLSSVRSGLSSAADFKVEAPRRDWAAIGVQAACAAVLAFALICWALPAGTRRLRPVLLVAEVVVPGILGGVLLSTALFASWIVSGPTLARPVIVAAAALAVLLPFVTGRQFWCTHACPFGAASELISKVPVPKFSPGPTARRWLGWIGATYLLAIPAIVILKPDFDLSRLEPFPAFSLLAAPAASLVIAIAFLLISMFAPKLWCRFLCPTGRVVNFFTTGGGIFRSVVKKQQTQSNQPDL